MNSEFYYKDPRLEMTSVGRVTARLVCYSGYGVLVAAAVAFSLSDVGWLRSAGLLLSLFLLDRIWDIGKADRPMVRLPSGKVNLRDYLSPAAFAVLEYAFERALL